MDWYLSINYDLIFISLANRQFPAESVGSILCNRGIEAHTQCVCRFLCILLFSTVCVACVTVCRVCAHFSRGIVIHCAVMQRQIYSSSTRYRGPWSKLDPTTSTTFSWYILGIKYVRSFAHQMVSFGLLMFYSEVCVLFLRNGLQ